MGGGLGGGSADAAATLVALNQLWRLNKTQKELYEIALSLGADVPVCLFSHLEKVSAAHFSGVGEVVTHTSPRPSWYFLLVNPNKNLPTADVFREFELGNNTPTGHKNDFEYAAIKLVPEIAHILEFLRAATGNLFARMTGTGSTCFAVFENIDDAAKAASQVPENYWKVVASQHSY